MMQFPARSFMDEKMDVNIHLPHEFEVIKRNLRLAPKRQRGVLGNQQYFRRILPANH
jgi:hypothetical protein